MHTEGHDMGKPENVPAHPSTNRDSEQPGYETQDVSVRGIVTFLAGLSGFVIIFFFFCFIMGKVINYEIVKSDGPNDKWHSNLNSVGETPHGEKREDLASDAAMEQRQLAAMTQVFPTPRLEMDDGNQDPRRPARPRRPAAELLQHVAGPARWHGAHSHRPRDAVGAGARACPPRRSPPHRP